MHDSGTQNPKVCKLRRVVQECGGTCPEKVSRRTREMDKFEEDAKTKVLDALQDKPSRNLGEEVCRESETREKNHAQCKE